MYDVRKWCCALRVVYDVLLRLGTRRSLLTMNCSRVYLAYISLMLCKVYLIHKECYESIEKILLFRHSFIFTVPKGREEKVENCRAMVEREHLKAIPVLSI